ncbi:hypothetical protein CLOP_g12297 [Closterium sp. NIES-67]|nr:hypothetical protein CLOP_g12297 [Closterium sp. NIES-67]
MAVIVTQVKDSLDDPKIFCNDDFCYQVPDPLLRLSNEDKEGGVEIEGEVRDPQFGVAADVDGYDNNRDSDADLAGGAADDNDEYAVNDFYDNKDNADGERGRGRRGGSGKGGKDKRERRSLTGGKRGVVEGDGEKEQGEEAIDVGTLSDATCPELFLLRHGRHLFPMGSPATPAAASPTLHLERPSSLALCMHTAALPSLPFFSPFISPPPPLENAEVALHHRVFQEIANLTEHLTGDPNNAHLLLERGKAWFSIHRFPEAIADAQRAVDVLSAATDNSLPSAADSSPGDGVSHAPELPRALLSLGQALHVAGRVQEAVEANERAAAILSAHNTSIPATSAPSSSSAMSAASSSPATSAAASSADWVTPSAAWVLVGLSYHWLPDADKAERAFELAVKADPRNRKAYESWAMHRRMTGNLKGVLPLYAKWSSLTPRNPKAQLAMGCCRQALGHMAHAVSSFSRIIDTPSDPEDAPILFQAFYQREIAIFTAMLLDSSSSDFSIESTFSTKFLNHWAYKKDPRNLFPGYAMLPAAAAFAPRPPPRREAEEEERERERVVEAADLIGRRVQYRGVGNIVNKRAQRAAGMAALEVMQSARATWRRWAKRIRRGDGVKEERRDEKENEDDEEDEEEDEEEEEEDEEEEEGEGMPVDGWKGLFSIGARWRQIVEPCEPVIWTERLRSTDSSLVGNSNTPISVFRQLTTKYADYYNRTLSVLKHRMVQQQHVFSGDSKRIDLSQADVAKVGAAETEYDLFGVVGQSFLVTTPCHSTASPGLVLNGTEILVKEVSSPLSLELSIRTTRYVDRFDQFDRELRAAWEHLCGLMADGAATAGRGGTDVEDAILRLAYFWYQALPLSRGTAVVGYATLLGLFLAAGKEITASIPRECRWTGKQC